MKTNLAHLARALAVAAEITVALIGPLFILAQLLVACGLDIP